MLIKAKEVRKEKVGDGGGAGEDGGETIKDWGKELAALYALAGWFEEALKAQEVRRAVKEVDSLPEPGVCW